MNLIKNIVFLVRPIDFFTPVWYFGKRQLMPLKIIFLVKLDTLVNNFEYIFLFFFLNITFCKENSIFFHTVMILRSFSDFILLGLKSNWALCEISV